MTEQIDREKAEKIDVLLRQIKDISPELPGVLQKIPVKISNLEIEGLDVREGYPDLEPLKGGFVAKLELSFPGLPWATRTYTFTHISRKGVDKLLEKRDQKEGVTLYDFSGNRLIDYGSYSVIGNRQFYRYFHSLSEKFPICLAGQPTLANFWKEQGKSQS